MVIFLFALFWADESKTCSSSLLGLHSWARISGDPAGGGECTAVKGRGKIILAYKLIFMDLVCSKFTIPVKWSIIIINNEKMGVYIITIINNEKKGVYLRFVFFDHH